MVKTGSKHFNDSKSFFEYSNDIDDIYKNTKEFNLNEQHNTLSNLII